LIETIPSCDNTLHIAAVEFAKKYSVELHEKKAQQLEKDRLMIQHQ
jgi:hypothetical protein